MRKDCFSSSVRIVGKLVVTAGGGWCDFETARKVHPEVSSRSNLTAPAHRDPGRQVKQFMTTPARTASAFLRPVQANLSDAHISVSHPSTTSWSFEYQAFT
jgi:hypothetical protein